MEYQLAPTQIHRKNIAERFIQTFKNNFTTIKTGINKKFSKNEWNSLLPEVELTLYLIKS